MIELIIGTYGVACWLVFKKFKLVPVTTYSVVTAIYIGIGLLLSILIMLTMFHPASKDGRFYVFSTPIVSQVRGLVVEVIPEGKDVKKGEVLFRIDPKPYEIEIERLEAALAVAKTNAEQLKEKLNAAEAATEQVRSELKTAESDFERQTAENLERAKATVTTVKTQYEFAAQQLKRQEELLNQGVGAQLDYDRDKGRFDALAGELLNAEGAERQAAESVVSGKDRLQSVREQLRRAEAQEQEARIAAEAELEGVNPQVRQLMAELDAAKWDLEQTVTRAPADGYVTQVTLRPGQMAVSFPISPVMVFVHDEEPIFAASYPQNVIENFEVGLEAELAFKARPGDIYSAKIRKILPVTPEGVLSPSGQVRALTPASATGHFIVLFEVDEEVKKLGLPAGSQALTAVYTHKVHAMSIVRKIILRMKSWENYLVFH